LGRPALGDWLEQWFRRELGQEIHASADSGTIRTKSGRFSPGVDLEAAVGRALAAFDAHEAAPGIGRVARPARATARPGKRRSPSRPTRATAGRTATAGRQAPRPPGTRASHPYAVSRCPNAHARTIAQVLEALQSRPEGLSPAEAARRLAQDGPNRIADVAARSDLEILLDQFKSVPVALLAGSGLVSLSLRAYADAAAIATVLAANGTIGFVTERHAEQTVSSLRRLAPGIALVLRNGRELMISAHEVVAGDVLVLKPGRPVAADARLIEAHRLSANEAPLTGESLPVRKSPADGLEPDVPLASRHNMVHLGTVVSGGQGRAVVTATGESTELGRIRALAEGAEAPQTRLQTELDGLGQRLAIGATALCAGVVTAGLLRGRAAGPLMRTAVALGVAAIPEGLPTVATSLLASGIRALRAQGVYARSLGAIENLGAVDVACLDKTGTLTENRMHVATIVVGTKRLDLDGQSKDGPGLPGDAASVCVLCSEVERNGAAWTGSATELALLQLAQSQGVDPLATRRGRSLIEMKQRSEHHPYMVTLHRDKGGAFVAVKGRPQEVLRRCVKWFDGRRSVPLPRSTRRQLLQLNDQLAADGRRVLALACRRQQRRTLGETGGLTWLGLVGLADPVREGIAETIERFRQAGIQPKMLTGDQLGTAQAVAREIRLDGGGAVVDAATLPEQAAAILEPAEQAVGFARSSPGMKLELVRALQQRGHVVAMTGDGINDGPALRMADVGVSMGAAGTDFAQSMSDLVLQGDHPRDLLHAVAQGRTAYLNVKKAVKYLVATNLSELAVTGICATLGLPDPLDPLALLWTNLITDVSPAIALGLEPPEPDILERPPFPRSAGLLDRDDWRRVITDGSLMTGATLAGFLYALGRYGPGPRARTMAFMTLTGSQLAYALAARSEGRITDPRLRRNALLNTVTVVSLGLQASTAVLPPLRSLLRTAPLSPGDWLVAGTLAAVPALVREAMKSTPTSARDRRSAKPQATGRPP
jgi:Ca2+-transporting ATPase